VHVCVCVCVYFNIWLLEVNASPDVSASTQVRVCGMCEGGRLGGESECVGMCVCVGISIFGYLRSWRLRICLHPRRYVCVWCVYGLGVCVCVCVYVCMRVSTVGYLRSTHLEISLISRYL